MPRPESPCGTYSAYRRHLRRREPVCGPCLTARDEETAARRSERADVRESSVEVSLRSGLGLRGDAVFRALVGEGDAPADVEALALETARAADRLEDLDAIIAGKGVLNLMRFRLNESWGEEGDRTVKVEVKFDHVLAEARQTQLAFERLVKACRAQGADSGAKEADPFDAFLADSGNIARFPTPTDRKQA